MQPIGSPTMSGRDCTVARQQQRLSNRALPTSGVGLLGERLLEGPDTLSRSRARRTPESAAPWPQSLSPAPRTARPVPSPPRPSRPPPPPDPPRPPHWARLSSPTPHVL